MPQKAGKNLVAVKRLDPCGHLSVYLVPTDGYPLSGAQREQYLENFMLLQDKLRLLMGAPQESVLLMAHLHHDAASEHLSKNGAAWLPEVGVAVWPHKPPPAIWTQEEFEAFVPGEIPRPPISMIFRLNGREIKSDHVATLMGGRGALIQFWPARSAPEYYKSQEQYFRRFITDPLHLAFPFFFPLLDLEAVRSMTEEVFASVFESTRIYVRESNEDRGLLILSEEPLEKVFEELDWDLQRLA